MSTLPNTMTLGNGPYESHDYPQCKLTGAKILKSCPEQFRDITDKTGVLAIETLVGDICEEDRNVKFSFYYEPKVEEPGCYSVAILSLFVDGCEIFDTDDDLREQLAEALEQHLMKPQRVNLFETLAKRFKPNK